MVAVSLKKKNKNIITGWNDGSIEILAANSGTLLKTCKYHKKEIYHVAVSENAQHVISTSGDKTIAHWDLTTDSTTELHTEDDYWPGHNAAINKNGTIAAAVVHGGIVKVWDVVTSKCIENFNFGSDTHLETIIDDPNAGDTKVIARGPRKSSIKIGSVDTGQSFVLGAYIDNKHLNSVATDKNGKKILALSSEKTIAILDGIDGMPYCLLFGPDTYHGGQIGSITLDGTKIITVADQTIRIIDIDTGRCLALKNPYSVDMGGDYKVTISSDGTLTVFVGRREPYLLEVLDISGLLNELFENDCEPTARKLQVHGLEVTIEQFLRLKR